MKLNYKLDNFYKSCYMFYRLYFGFIIGFIEKGYVYNMFIYLRCFLLCVVCIYKCF